MENVLNEKLKLRHFLNILIIHLKIARLHVSIINIFKKNTCPPKQKYINVTMYLVKVVLFHIFYKLMLTY